MKLKIETRKFLTTASALVIAIIFPAIAFAQTDNVGIGTTTPDASAVLDLSSTEKGFLVPRMDETQRDNISSPATGLLVYNTDDQRFQYYNGSNWVDLLTTGNISLTDGNIFVGNGSDVATEVTVSGDATLSNTGVLNITSDSIKGDLIDIDGNTDGDIMFYDGTDWDRMPAGLTSTPTNGQILIGNGSGFSLDTLIAGTNVTITRGSGTIEIEATGGGGGLDDGTVTNSTIRWDGADWIENTLFKTDGAVATLGDNATAGQVTMFDGSSNTITLNVAGHANNRNYTIPDAGSDASFLMSIGSQTIEGSPTIEGDLTISNQNELRLGELNANGSNYLSFAAPASLTSDYNFTWPVDDGNIGEVLTTDGSGVLSWDAFSAWSLTGNSGITGSNFIGTNDNADLRFVTNTGDRMIITATGRVGIGTANPDGVLDVLGSPGSTRKLFLPANNSEPADSDFSQYQWSLWVDEGNDEIEFKTRKSDGSFLERTLPNFKMFKDTVTISGSNNVLAIDQNNGGYLDIDVTVTGAEEGDFVIVTPDSDKPVSLGIGYAFVSATDTITIRFTNNDWNDSASANGDYYILVFESQ